jgi:hypothetical protein
VYLEVNILTLSGICSTFKISILISNRVSLFVVNIYFGSFLSIILKCSLFIQMTRNSKKPCEVNKFKKMCKQYFLIDQFRAVDSNGNEWKKNVKYLLKFDMHTHYTLFYLTFISSFNTKQNFTSGFKKWNTCKSTKYVLSKQICIKTSIIHLMTIMSCKNIS